jgi:hypothetical protein
MTDPLPLTWAQLSWLLGPPVLGHTDAWRHPIVMPLPVSGPLARGQVEAALRHVIDRFPPLRSRLCRTTSGTLAQRVAEPDDEALGDVVARLGVVELSPDDRSPDVAVQEHIAALRDDPHGPGIGVLLRGDVATLIVAHAFVDPDGVSVLATAFQDALRDPAPGPRQDRLYRILEDERGPRAAVRSARCIRYLMATARRATALDLLEPVQEYDRGDIPAAQYDSGRLFRAVAALGLDTRVSRAAAMLSLALVGYCAVRDRQGAWVVGTSGNRLSAEDSSFVGLLMRTGWLVAERRPTEPARELVRRIAAHLLDSALHSRFDPVAGYAALPEAGLACQPNFYFNYWEAPTTRWATEPDAADTCPDTTEITWLPMPIGGDGCSFEFNAYTAKQAMTIVVKYDDRIFRKTDVERLIGFLHKGIEALHRNPDLLVRNLIDLF